MRSEISRVFSRAAAFARIVMLAQAPMILVAVAIFSASASAQSFVYVVSLGPNGPEFGAVDLANGRFRYIATPEVGATPVSLGNLVWWNGSLLSLASSDPIAGYLVKINPATG